MSSPTVLRGENSGLATGPGVPPAGNYKEAGASLSNPHSRMSLWLRPHQACKERVLGEEDDTCLPQPASDPELRSQVLSQRVNREPSLRPGF